MKKTVLITGATSGIGKAAALQLAKDDFTVVIHGRTKETCKVIIAEIIRDTGNSNVDYVVADLSDMVQVKAMAEEVKTRFTELNVLINNAGTFSVSRKLTKEGFELTWAVNYLSRFLLTNSLLDVLKKNGPSRIIDISGAYHKKGEIHWDDISLKENYSMSNANNQSKLANVLFTYKLASLLEGSSVTVNTLHPGAVNTGAVLKSKDFSVFAKLLYRLISLFFKTPSKGAETTVFLAKSLEVEGVTGKYFVNKKAVRSSNTSYQIDLQNKLWELSKKMLRQANIEL